MLRYLVEKRRSTGKQQKATIPVGVIRDAMISYLTPLDPGNKDIIDIEFKDVPPIINVTIYYERSKSKTKKD